MNRRISLALGVAAVLAVAACGDDDAPATADTAAPDTGAPDTAAPDTAAPDTTAPSSPVPGGTGFQHPTGADEAIISLSYPGGFTTARYGFSQAPALIISGDGLAYTGAAVPAIYPGPLVWPMQVQTISEDGIQAVLAAADEAGLFTEVDYEDETSQQIADAPTTLLTISVDGTTYEHAAYALGFGAGPEGGDVEQSPERQALQDFVDGLTDLAAVAGAGNVGEPEIFAPASYEIVATPVDDLSAYESDGIEPTVTAWPTDAGVALADASTCTVVAADAVGELLETSTELTFFTDADITYEVWARPTLPARTCDT